MDQIPTITGHISPEELGCAFAYAHIFVHDEGFTLQYRDAAIKPAQQKLQAAYDADIRTILDTGGRGHAETDYANDNRESEKPVRL